MEGASCSDRTVEASSAPLFGQSCRSESPTAAGSDCGAQQKHGLQVRRGQGDRGQGWLWAGDGCCLLPGGGVLFGVESVERVSMGDL